MIKAGAISKGMCLIIKGDPYLVAEREFVNPGKGSAFAKLKLKNLKNGSVLKETMKTNDNVEEADVYDKQSQFLYADDNAYHFMDAETYDQYEVEKNGLETQGNYMREGDTYKVIFFDDKAIDIILPTKMVFVVTESPEAVKGDTVTGATKMVTIETGIEVKVPIFIKQDEKIMVNTETNEYVERVNN